MAPFLCGHSVCVYIYIYIYIYKRNFAYIFLFCLLVIWASRRGWLTIVLQCCYCWLGYLTRKIVYEMTYNVSSETLNPATPYHTFLHSYCACLLLYVRRCLGARMGCLSILWLSGPRRKSGVIRSTDTSGDVTPSSTLGALTARHVCVRWQLHTSVSADSSTRPCPLTARHVCPLTAPHVRVRWLRHRH